MAEDALSPRRFAHCQRVADMAEGLAEEFALDGEKVVVASFLHDIVKEWPVENLLEAGRIYTLDQASMDHPALLHAPVAARILADRGQVTDPDILEAIAYHTIGRPGMGEVALTVYIADYLEPGRPYRKVEEIQEARSRGLDALGLYVCAQKLSFMLRREAFVHPQSFALYQDLWKRQEEGSI